MNLLNLLVNLLGGSGLGGPGTNLRTSQPPTYVGGRSGGGSTRGDLLRLVQEVAR